MPHGIRPGRNLTAPYGWRGRQGLVADASVALTLAELDRNPQKIIGCDYNEETGGPTPNHHENHTNVLRCNGAVDGVKVLNSFGPTGQDIQDALDALDR